LGSPEHGIVTSIIEVALEQGSALDKAFTSLGSNMIEVNSSMLSSMAKKSARRSSGPVLVGHIERPP
jgi:hypothetical protein